MSERTTYLNDIYIIKVFLFQILNILFIDETLFFIFIKIYDFFVVFLATILGALKDLNFLGQRQVVKII